MPKISDLRAIAERRSSTPWGVIGDGELWPPDERFVRVAANTYDQLLRIAEAANTYINGGFKDNRIPIGDMSSMMLWTGLEEAIQQLEGE